MTRVWFAALLILTVVVAGCATSVPPGPTQAASGPGWELASVGAVPFREDVVRIERVDDGAFLVEMQVAAEGSGGCGAPTFDGFDIVDGGLVGRIVRGPTYDDTNFTCVSTSSVVLAVRLHPEAIPTGVTRISTNEPCDVPGCAGHPVPLP